MPDRIATPTAQPSPEVRAIQQEATAERYLELADRDARELSPAEFNALQDTSRTLNEAGTR
ncbi:hypothetical protein ACWEG1_05965 [Streptomyces bauhiniae]